MALSEISNFPTSIDSLADPSGSTPMNTTDFEHASLHVLENDAIENLQTKVGVNDSAVTTSLDYLIKVATDPGHTHAALYNNKVSVTSADNTSDFLATKLLAGEGIDLSVGSPGATEKLTVSGEDATTTNKGIASFNTNHFTLTAGAVSIIANGIDDTLIDWGTGTNQVSALDIPITDSGDYYTGTEVETALQEIGAAGYLSNIVEDTTPQLGGQLDVNGNAIGDGTLELLAFTETALAVNHINITNASIGGEPIIQAVGDDTNINLRIVGKGTGHINIPRTLPATVAQELSGIKMSVDSSAQDATSIFHGLEVGTTGTPAGEVAAIGVIGTVRPIHQHTTTLATPSQTEFAGRKTTGGTVWADGIDGIEIFVVNSDAIYVGSATQFDEIEIVMGTGATKTVKPTFWYNTAADTWTEFEPSDGTLGFQTSGNVAWSVAGITALWTNDGDPGGADTTAGYWIKIVRARVADPGTPTPTSIKIGAAVEYGWDASGDISIRNLVLAGSLSGVTTLATTDNISIGGSNKELRFYEGANYVGFEAPALGADQIWVLPTADAVGTQYLQSDGAGTLSWTTPAGAGDVTKVGVPVDNQVGVWTGDGTIEGDTGLTWTGTQLNIITGNTLDVVDVGALEIAGTAVASTAAELNITDGGDTTEKVLNTQTKASAYLNTLQENLVDSTPTKVLLETENFDIGADFDTGNNKFVTPVAGYYLVTISVDYTAIVATKQYRAHIYVDGAAVKTGRNHSSLAQNFNVPCTAIVYAAAAKDIESYAEQKAGVNTVDIQNGATFTYMDIHLLSI